MSPLVAFTSFLWRSIYVMDSCKSRMSSLIFVFSIDLGTYEANILC
nr:MAG TPA: hypothetical protein [Bacteriophage sp.]DAX99868.1 MAG TPA: hypothetical protein [Caudoviricetes sp.]